MRLRRIGTAAVALALTAPATAHAATWTVTPGGGPCTDAEGQRQCSTLTGAAAAADDTDTVAVTPGTWSGATFAQDDLTVTGQGLGIARVNGTLAFTGSGTFTIRRLSVHGQAGGSALSFTSDALAADKAVRVESSILSGSGGGAAIAASTSVVLNTIAITGRHVTIADVASAPAVAEGENDDSIDVTFHDSIVQGDRAGANVADNNDVAPHHASLFADPDETEDFRLRVGAPAIDAGGAGEGGETADDVEGETRAGTWDRGGDEFVNHAPAKPGVSASASQVERGQAVGFAVSGATDPDGALGDDVVKYVWDFGDGTVEERTPGSWAHTYAAAGRYEVRVRAVDRTNTSGPASDPVAIVVNDPPPPPAPPPSGGITSLTQLPGFEGGYAPNRRGPDAGPPFVALTWPRPGMRVRIRRGVPLLRGRTADPSGVRRIDLALMRRAGRRCRWFDGRRAFRLGSCNAPVWFKAILDDFDWRYAFPRRVRPRPAAYFAFVRATDYLGKRTPPSRPIRFRYTR